jgi:hypothetical protein
MKETASVLVPFVACICCRGEERSGLKLQPSLVCYSVLTLSLRNGPRRLQISKQRITLHGKRSHDEDNHLQAQLGTVLFSLSSTSFCSFSYKTKAIELP